MLLIFCIFVAGLCAIAQGFVCALWTAECRVEIPAFLTDEQDAQTIVSIGVSMIMVGVATCLPAGSVLINSLCCGGITRDSTAVNYLFAGHFLSAWGDRMWQMAVPLVFMDTFQNSLMPIALYTMIVYLSVVYLMPYLGAWIDKSSRLYVQQLTCAVANSCIILTCGVFCLLVQFDPEEGVEPQKLSDPTILTCFVALVIFGCAGELMNGANTVSVEKDWVVVIADRTGMHIGAINTLLRRIDLTCKVLSPAIFAPLYQSFGDSFRKRIYYGAIVAAGWNLLAFPLELLLTRIVYSYFQVDLDSKIHSHEDGLRHSHPMGHIEHYHLVRYTHGRRKIYNDVVVGLDEERRLKERHSHGHGDHDHTHDGDEELDHDHDLDYIGYKKTEAQSAGIIRSFVLGFQVYRKEFVFLASLAYTMLYMTVMDNGALMTSYLEWSKVEPFYFGVGRGLGAGFGLLGTFAFPWMQSKNGGCIGKTGLLSIWLFWFSLLPVPILYVYSATGLDAGHGPQYALIICVACSRAWLWAFDLAITELCQDYVAEEHRGLFSSVQTSSYQFFYILIQIIGIVSPDPANFELLVILSIFIVFFAAVVYTIWYYNIYNARHGLTQILPTSPPSSFGTF
mmetsp:Transcript_13233/g.21523  ORF Transcript_13233/g.21523 Transcript_13233/m.21523 type:complete len:621 (-) Transcript_13233:1521-3383(-)